MPESGIVLLVEDNPKILELNRRMLEQEGCMVLTAASLTEARQRLKIASPDVAVLDVMLPDGSGLDFLSELRAVSAAPVLFLTAKADRSDIMAGLTAGGNDYITKPYDIDEFRMRVKGFLRLVGADRGNAGAMRKTTYVPDKLRVKLEQIHEFPLTTIVAPAGYGKTTAVSVFAESLPPERKVFRLNVLSGSSAEFWRDLAGLFSSYAKDFSEALLKLGIPGDIAAQRELLRLLGDAFGGHKNDAYVIIDDFHRMQGQAPQGFFAFICRQLLKHIHIVILSRAPVLEPDDRFLLSGHINEITERDLWYGPKDTKDYFTLCGCPISDEDAMRLSETTEGWIAALYLHMKSYAETGRFSQTGDIHSLTEAALFTPLSENERELLMAISLFPVFSGTQAAFVSGMEDAENMLRELMESNSFISCESGGSYKLHHLFREVVCEAFGRLPQERQKHVTRRVGLSYLGEKEYIAAQRMFYAAGDYENLLLALEQDYGASLTGENKSEFLAWFRDCPKDILYARPIALLICARKLYLYNMRNESAETLETLKRILGENTLLSEREQNNLLGEAEIGAGFLVYNDIAAMSACHKRACKLMDRPTNSVSPFVPWTCGSPSVFVQYHRKKGGADLENEALKEAMPWWYRLNQNHGSGAEHLFEGELYFLRGNFTDAIISLHRALHGANRHRQPVMAVAADFLRLRIETFQGNFESAEPTLQAMRGMAGENRLTMLTHTVDVCEAWLYALTGQPDKAADWIIGGNLENTRLLFPAIHFLHMTYCQLLLGQGEYAALIAREDEERTQYRIYPNLLAEIYLDIQLAAAYEHLGRRWAAINHLMSALEAAMPDSIFMPFAENGNLIMEPLREMPSGIWDKQVEKILALYLQNRLEKQALVRTAGEVASIEALSEREASIARLLSAGMSNKEIADKLYLSESRVKANLSGIFQKLGIANKKEKRRILASMFEVSP
jgi:LuxR family maltose regulon positive regulatory protein